MRYATVVCPVVDPIPNAIMGSRPSSRIMPMKSPDWIREGSSSTSVMGREGMWTFIMEDRKSRLALAKMDGTEWVASPTNRLA